MSATRELRERDAASAERVYHTRDTERASDSRLPAMRQSVT